MNPWNAFTLGSLVAFFLVFAMIKIFPRPTPAVEAAPPPPEHRFRLRADNPPGTSPYLGSHGVNLYSAVLVDRDTRREYLLITTNNGAAITPLLPATAASAAP